MQHMTVIGIALVVAGCGSEEASVPTPDGAAEGSLLVLETRPCNWLQPSDRCDVVGLVRIGLDGQELEELTPSQPMARNSIALSPERDAIAWGWNDELWVMPLDAGEPRRINEKLLRANMSENVSDPAWSPDGFELLYRWAGANEAETWYRIQVATGVMTEVAMPVDCYAMDWSPDGETVACHVWHTFNEAGSEVGRADIYLVDLTTFEATAVTAVEDAIDDISPQWSPDGRWLAFSRSTRDPSAAEEVSGIWLVEVETRAGRRVAEGRLSMPTWSPNGGHLAAWDEGTGRVVIMGRDGSGLTTLDHDPRQFVLPRWLGPDS